MRKLFALALVTLSMVAAPQAQQRDPRVIISDIRTLLDELERSIPKTVSVTTSAELQAAATLAQDGQEIVLQAGATYVGPITLPAHAGVVKIRSSAQLPDRRIGPADAALLPTITAPNADGALRIIGTSGWIIDGVRLGSVPGGFSEVVVIQGSNNIYLDRILLVAGPDGQKRGVRGNGTNVTLTRSYIANIIRAGQDSQAFAAWEGAGPYTITDNYLEASGENILFGGSDNLAGAASNPSDILIEGNYLFKPLAWKLQPGTVKNLLELKNASHVVVRNNVMENNWVDAQSGFGVLIKPVNQDGRAPWTTVKDVLVERNYIKNVSNGINLLGYDYSHVSQQASGYVFRKNVIETAGIFVQFASEIADLTIEDNVVDNGYNIATVYLGSVKVTEGQPTRPAAFAAFQLNFNRNVARHNSYGVIGGGMGILALNQNIQTWTFTDNQFVGIPGGVKFPATTTSVTDAVLAAAKAALLTELGR